MANHHNTSLSCCHNDLQWDSFAEEIPLSRNPAKLYRDMSGVFLVYSKENKVKLLHMHAYKRLALNSMLCM